jgi:hypothetical protein
VFVGVVVFGAGGVSGAVAFGSLVGGGGGGAAVGVDVEPAFANHVFTPP